MTYFRYRDLTEEEKEFFCNGCGGKGGPVDPPDWIFKASCDHHDANYGIGHTEADRLKADIQFYEAMKEDARDFSWWKRSFYLMLAYVYYLGVRAFGKPFFRYSDDYMTREELDAELQEWKNNH